MSTKRRGRCVKHKEETRSEMKVKMLKCRTLKGKGGEKKKKKSYHLTEALKQLKMH